MDAGSERFGCTAARCEHGYGIEGCTHPMCPNAAEERDAACAHKRTVPDETSWQRKCVDCGVYLHSDRAADPDPLHPPVSVLVKLGSALVHAEELTEPGAHPFDLDAFKNLASDPEVVAWRAAMDAMALLPVKR